MSIKGVQIHITGIVQGVGFRPFVYNLATRLGLKGWVRNTAAGVDIAVDGSSETLDVFIQALKTEPPPLARIDSFLATDCPAAGFTSFEIVHSASQSGDFIPISPDVSICPDCLSELFDPADRRYRYPFINCTNCGPRFTIITDIPYDRPNTTMAGFSLCADCAAEYHDPSNRRFHAQPVACPACGPQLWLEYKTGDVRQGTRGDAAIYEAQRLLRSGSILAVKGLGGFHLACDATNAEAVSELRRRKLRVDKAFAVMMPNLVSVEAHCFVNEGERHLLESRQRPIVILQRRPGSSIASAVAPGQATTGVMLPYTPLHYLLMDGEGLVALVMTSGNLSEEPIATDNQEARERLSGIADAFLMHNRDIRTRCDDSVVRVIKAVTIDAPQPVTQQSMFLRRSRGYAPDPIRLPFELPPLLATGPELKNTFCLARQRYAFLSHHIGDLENYETLQSFEDGIDHFERLFRVQPEAIAYDLHPNYLATRYALERAETETLPAIGVQHHHAHIAACMADNGLSGEQPVIGAAFDGTGYGEDGAIWGGEFLVTSYTGFQRLAHLASVPLPGGDVAVREPWRMALAWLWQCGLDWEAWLEPFKAGMNGSESDQTIKVLRYQLEKGVNAPLTSSMGRLFDAAAALAGVRQRVNYEAQAAIEFEAMADPAEPGAYAFEIIHDDSQAYIIHPRPLFAALLADLRGGVPKPVLSARFHNGVAQMTRQVATHLRQDTGISEVALSGGVWQNITLLTKTVNLLEGDGFTVLLHHQTPPNDGGVALGQAVIAAKRLSLPD
jgi:hydrogenase maturation protein HypF